MSQSKLTYITVADFKQIVGMKPKQLINFFHYKSGSSNAKIPVEYKGQNSFKAQGGIDTTKPVIFMHNDDEGFLEGCFINPSEATDAGSL